MTDQLNLSIPSKLPSGLSFVKTYSVNGGSPLSFACEDFIVNKKGLAEFGSTPGLALLCYSDNGFSTVYHERNQQQMSARQFADFFSELRNRQLYIANLKNIQVRIKELVRELESTNISPLNSDQIWRQVDRQRDLHLEAFTLYLVSQPYRLRGIEDSARFEISKRIARTKVPECLAVAVQQFSIVCHLS